MPRLSTRALGAALPLLIAAGVAAAPASAAPVTFTHATNGTSVTLGDSAIPPSSTVAVNGSGYAAGQWIIVKIDGDANLGVSGTAAGDDALTPAQTAGTPASGWPTFETDPDGTYNGTITMPATIATTPAPPLPAGQHRFNFLSGALPTTVSHGFDWIAGNVQAPFTFAAVATPAVGLTPTSTTAGSSVSFTGSDFPASTAVTATLDGAALPIGAPTTTASGGFTGSFTVPAGTAAGTHTVRFTAGATGVDTTLTVTTAGGGGGGTPPALSATVTTPNVTAGGSVSFALAGFVKTAGGGQLVGVRIDDGRTLAGCVATDATGSATGSVPVPADTTDGAHTIRFLAGTACVSGGAQTEAPARSVAASFTVGGGAGGGGAAASTTPEGTDPAAAGAASGTEGPAAAAAAPVATAALASKTLKLGKSGSFKLTMNVSGAGDGTVAVRSAQKVKVGKKRQTVIVAAKRSWKAAQAGATTLTLRTTKQARDVIKRNGQLRVRVTVVDGAGRVSSKVLVLK